MSSYKRYNLLILLGFGILYSSISLVNHYLFRTYALDLGAYTNALYDYAHFDWNDSRAFKSAGENLLADHFDLHLILFSPLSWIFKSYTLLIIQIIFLLIGGWGIYQYFSLSNDTKRLGRWAMIWYLSFFGIYSALAFDYHSNVIAASIVPWFFYYIKKKQLNQSILAFIFILIAKENMSLWMVFIAIGLAWEYRKNKNQRNILLILSAFSIIYFIAVTSWIMPFFSNKGHYPHFHYSVLGNNTKEAFLFLLTHPLKSLQLLFINHLQITEADFIKSEFYIYLLISGFFVLFRKPVYILMLVPVFFQKMYHNNYFFWSTINQYSIEFVPIMSIGIFDVLSNVKIKKLKFGLIAFVLIGNIVVSIRTMDAPIVRYNRDRIRIYQYNHFHRDFDVEKLHKKLREIPKDAIVSAHSPLMPHISWRDKVYQFPDIGDAQYILISMHEAPYPLSREDFDKKVVQLKSNSQWGIWYEEDGVVFFERNFNAKSNN